ncbi:MAG: arginine N-succinyltransferase [Pseudomonadota bacterium]
MYVVRPAQSADAAAIAAMARDWKQSVYSFPRGPDAIGAAIERSLAAHAALVTHPGEQSYMFVLENLDDASLAGCASMAALAGAQGMYLALRNDVIQQVSRDLGIRHSVHALNLCSDLTNYSQLSSFYVRNWQHAGPEAALLSRARLLYAASEPQRFADKFFTALAGVTDVAGDSPFWDALGAKFFQMNFQQAERAVEGTRNRALLVELMPHYPVYVPLLPAPARAAMGQVHPEAALPVQLLSHEGFAHDEFVDLFDGGPILQAHKMALRSFSASVPRWVAQEGEDGGTARHAYLVSTVGKEDFRATIVECEGLGMSESVPLLENVRRALDVVTGDQVLTVRL